jgi:hypothetical protein
MKMNVLFRSVKFQNDTSFDMPVKIEVPIGGAVFRGNAPANQTVTIELMENNSSSVRIVADDPEHGATQDFILQSVGNPLFLEQVEVQFVPASIQGSVNACTG